MQIHKNRRFFVQIHKIRSFAYCKRSSLSPYWSKWTFALIELPSRVSVTIVPTPNLMCSTRCPSFISSTLLGMKSSRAAAGELEIRDTGRVGADGRPRELHLEKGLAAVDFFNRNSPRIPGVTGRAGFNRRFQLVGTSQYFRVTELRLVEPLREDTSQDGSFHIITAINGRIAVAGEVDEQLRCDAEGGRSLLIPAGFGPYRILPLEDGETTVLKTTL